MPTLDAFNRDESLPVASRCWGMRGDEDRTAGREIERSGGGEDKMARVLWGALWGGPALHHVERAQGQAACVLVDCEGGSKHADQGPFWALICSKSPAVPTTPSV